eukprot:m.340874 g.340874  ORF g.340874 m.340874 type:complete len:179 (-) comp19611_c0_seq1:160-696(-)
MEPSPKNKTLQQERKRKQTDVTDCGQQKKKMAANETAANGRVPAEGDPVSAFLETITQEEKELMENDGAKFPPPETPLTAEVLANLKKIRRKVRNKQSARLSRLKNQQKVKDLEQQILEIDASNAEKKREIAELERRNLELKLMLGVEPEGQNAYPAQHAQTPYMNPANGTFKPEPFQ